MSLYLNQSAATIGTITSKYKINDSTALIYFIHSAKLSDGPSFQITNANAQPVYTVLDYHGGNLLNTCGFYNFSLHIEDGNGLLGKIERLCRPKMFCCLLAPFSEVLEVTDNKGILIGHIQEQFSLTRKYGVYNELDRLKFTIIGPKLLKAWSKEEIYRIFEGEKPDEAQVIGFITSRWQDLGKGEHSAPHFAIVIKSTVQENLQFLLVCASFLIGIVNYKTTGWVL